MRPAAAHSQFNRAVNDFTARPNSPEAIASMMHLACEAPGTIRGWAAKWLKDKCNIAVMADTEQGQDDATSTTATSIL